MTHPPSVHPFPKSVNSDLPPRPDLSHHTWLAFTADQDEAEASRTFQARYGSPPQFIVDVPGRTPAFGQIWLGPVPEHL